MNWSDEKYVKLYTRQTATWRMWPWQGRAVFPLLLQVANGAGLIDVGSKDPLTALSVLIMVPREVVEVGIAALIEDGTVERVGSGYLIPKYLEAQEATKTDSRKKADQRERERAKARVTTQAPVTECHPASPAVPLQPSPAQPSPTTSPEEDLPPPRETPTVPQVAAFHIDPPDLELIDSWTKEDFWRAAELTRRKWGFPPQKWPNPVTLSRWWGEARAQAEVRELALAFQDFAKAKHWREAKPPAPFAGFMSQWNNFLPPRSA